ncbi:YadA C-terminal domain-containing protein [Limnohabitans sp. G3-2]|uniref:YadA C-terminal domain-containing protein n=1 Tax=Limnohabitans sp. G3-2 TaxID=1100711 RepID=UPI0013041BF9|nr:YadA C-terminal domain-containing protein [Limnohabitans sp. G3-2]
MDLQTGTARLGDLSTSGEARVGGTLDVTGATTLSGATTVNSTLSVTGATTIVGATSVTGATTIVGTTNINTTGNAATRIGNAGAAATVVGNVVTATAGNSALALQNGEARVTVTNSLGNTHGLVVGESSTTLSGGTSSTNLTLNDNGATFSNAATGAPTRVTGVANGSGDFDAVNVRQFSAAVAGVAASANIPGLDTNKAVSVGVGMGSYMNAQALAFGGSYRFSDKGVLRATLATGLNSGGGKTSFGIGAGWSW